jgi:hypothetical protein
MATLSQPIDEPTLPLMGEADPRAALVPASRVKFRAADLLPGHVYRFNLKGKYGCAPYTFLERTADGTYKFKQLGTGYDWRVAATIVTRYLAGEEPDAATSTAEKISQETPSDSCELGSIEPSLTNAEQKAAVDEFLKLETELYTKADDLADEYQTLMQRFNDELLPLCDRMQAFLSQRGAMHIPGLPSWTSWRDRFLTTLQKKMKMSLATFKRRLKKFRELGDEEPAPEPEGEETENEDEPEQDEPVIYDSPNEQVTKWVENQHKVLTGEIGPMDVNPMRDGKDRIRAALQLLDEFQLALDDGLLDPVPQVARLRHEINKTHESKLTVVPLHHKQANEFVAKLHRHHKPIRVTKFSIGASIDGKMVGVAMCMRPACRALDDGRTIEVCRVAAIAFEDDDDARNACSFLYGACARIARDMGYSKIMTYLLDTEPGMSVRGAGWTLEKKGCGGKPQGLRKNRPNGHKLTPVTLMTKQRWARLLQTPANSEEDPQGYNQVGNRKPVSSVPAEVADDEADLA